MTTRRQFVLWLPAPVLLAACDRPQVSSRKFHAMDISSVDWGRGFELTDHTGRRRTLADFRGKVVMVFFGFTHCPDICPTAMAEMAQVVRRLGADGARVQALFITVDPERDTPAVLAKYVTAFHPSFLGLRGSSEETARIAQEFKVHFQLNKDAPGADAKRYMVDHSTGIFIYDADGKLRLYAGSNRSVERMTSDVRRLLRA
ncbi:MAG TPA: SCO family protein [Burkholderiaceae bacterium]|nr:SCO family protein [Burkholderiaceae bacterium]